MPRPLDPARDAARKAGARFFASSRGCKAGHAAGERYTSTGACRQCVTTQARPDRPGVRRAESVDPLAAVIG